MSKAIAAVLLDYARGFVKMPRLAIETLAAHPLTLTVFAVLLQRARWTPGAVLRGGHGVIGLEPGQCVFGRDELATLTNSTPDKIRVCLRWLEDLGFLTIHATNRGSVATIVNYCGNAEDAPAESPAGSLGVPQDSTSEPPLTRSKKKEAKKERSSRATPFDASWSPRDQERLLAAELGLDADREVARCVDHHRAKGNAWKDHDAAFRNWLRTAAEIAQRKNTGKAAGRAEPAPLSAFLADKENGF